MLAQKDDDLKPEVFHEDDWKKAESLAQQSNPDSDPEMESLAQYNAPGSPGSDSDEEESLAQISDPDTTPEDADSLAQMSDPDTTPEDADSLAQLGFSSHYEYALAQMSDSESDSEEALAQEFPFPDPKHNWGDTDDFQDKVDALA